MLGRLPMDASFPRPHSLVWLLSRVLMGEGAQTVEFREECIWPGANSTIWAGIDNSISVLGYRQPDNLSWSIQLSAASALEGIMLISRPLPSRPRRGCKTEEDANWRGWVMAEGEVASLRGWRISPHGGKGCCSYGILGLQFTNEIKMPKVCLLLKNTWLELLNEC